MKQTKNKILFLIGTLALAFVTFSCTPEVGQSTPTPTPSTDKCSVSYSSEHGTAPVTISVDKDTILSAEQLPELSDDGFTFDAELLLGVCNSGTSLGAWPIREFRVFINIIIV